MSSRTNQRIGSGAAPLLLAGALMSAAVTQARSEESTHWAFQPVQPAEAPADETGWALNEIDRFIAARLHESGLKPNPQADKRTLIRRVHFDLIGLPPTPAQVNNFLNDTSPGAFEKVVDRLLASQHYGERWGRHWLDLARYADTSGDGADAPVPEAHLYRDYVIDCFNQDLPYDQFIKEQVAGDILAKKDPDNRARERIIATSYVGLTRRFNNGEYRDMHLVIENTLSTIGKGMLGMSIGCARCHDHKYDPISVEDYYGLYGYFESTQYPHAGTESGRQRKNFTKLPGGGLAYAVFDKTDGKKIRDTRIHKGGNPGSHGDAAPRGFLDVINNRNAEIPEGESGRLQLAEWLASPDNQLTTRVMANRIWQYHFGKGLVKTSSSFGLQGEEPSHPQLLDWLADRLVKDGWSLKKMHKRILLSQTWRQSSDVSTTAAAKDPDNKLLSHYPRRRLEAEPIRDSVLFVSGRLQKGSPGAHPFPKPNSKDEYPYTQHRPFSKDYDHESRTVYLPSRRLGKHPYMETFNGPDPNECTAKRNVSTVPLQSLFWMNSDFLKTNAGSLAHRLAAHSDDPAKRIELGYELAYARKPSSEETKALTEYVKAHAARVPGDVKPEERETRAWTSLCRILLSGNEFIYVD
jgi:hypothetical protein